MKNHVFDFGYFFDPETATVDQLKKPPDTHGTISWIVLDRDGMHRHRITSFIRYQSGHFWAKPTAETINHVSQRMIVVTDDLIDFEIIDHADGTASIYARYNKILGSRLLGTIDPNTIPRHVK